MWQGVDGHDAGIGVSIDKVSITYEILRHCHHIHIDIGKTSHRILRVKIYKNPI